MMSLGETAASYGRKLIAKVYKPDADLSRAMRVYREFDEERGFRHYHDVCKARLYQDNSDQDNSARGIRSEEGELSRSGIQYAEIMSSDDAARLLQTLTAGQTAASVKKGNEYLQGYRFQDHPLQRKVIESLLTPEIDQILVDFFKSEYLVHWALLSRNPIAGERGIVSFKWHCDKGPARHLKLLFYLNGSEEHGGNTEFIDLDGSTRVAEKGYLFGRTRKRTREISVLSKLAGYELSSKMKPIRAGEAVIFPPATVLHRGISPTRAERYVLTLCILPSPVHWTEAFERGVICDLSQDAKWPKHADRLLQSLDAAG